MLRAMIRLESGRINHTEDGDVTKQHTEDEKQQEKQQESGQMMRRLSENEVQRVRKVYESWAGAYGADDATLWVEYALFEQGVSKQGSGRVYHRAVKALRDPDEFIQQYRSKVGLV